MPGILQGPRAAVFTAFLVNGLLFGTWVSRIPAVKAAGSLTEATLGIALLCLGLGTLLALPITTVVFARCGSRPAVGGAVLACCLLLPLAARAPDLPSLAATLVGFGAAMGTMDVAMNAQAALVERSAGRSIMASFHGLWSLGGLLGASLGAAFTACGSTPLQHFASVSAALALLGLAATRGLVRDRPDGLAAPVLVPPSRRALAVGLLASCGAVIEGGIAEWSGVYLKESLGARASVAATGFAAFSLTMMVGRFTGDRLIDRFGSVRLLTAGSALTGAAIAGALVWGDARGALVAFLLAGLGMSTVFPIAFSVAGTLGGAAPGQAIATVAAMAYGAGLAGPPLIGFLAAVTSLPVALSVLVVAAAAIATFAGRAVRGRRVTTV